MILAQLSCLLTTVESDSHMWNLIYMQRLLQEQGGWVRNLGCCVPPAETLRAVRDFRPDLVVVSSVNGNGHYQGRALVQAARALGDHMPPFVIGGKLTTAMSDNTWIADDLRAAGYSGVFPGADAAQDFVLYLRRFQGVAVAAG